MIKNYACFCLALLRLNGFIKNPENLIWLAFKHQKRQFVFMDVNDLSILRLSINNIKHQAKQAASNFKRTDMDQYNRQCQINSGINRMRIIWRNIASIEKVLAKASK